VIARRFVVALVVAAVSGGVAFAQDAKPGRIAVAIGPAWIGGMSMAPLVITETQPDGTPRTVLNAARSVTASLAAEARIGVRLTARLDVEAVGSYARPELQVTTSNDVEGAPNTSATEPLQQFSVGGGASWYFTPRDGRSRTLPFVSGSVAYARQLHTPTTLADSGMLTDVGGGVTRVLAIRSGKLKSVGLRGDLRARVRPKTFSIDGRTHVSPMIGVSLDLRF
jgi:hypothetical protein